MLHLDVKKLGRIEGMGHRITGNRQRSETKCLGWEFVHVCVDDATRVAYVEVLEDEYGTTTAGFFERALANHRQLGIRTRRVLTDNGGAYRSLFDELRYRPVVPSPLTRLRVTRGNGTHGLHVRRHLPATAEGREGHPDRSRTVHPQRAPGPVGCARGAGQGHSGDGRAEGRP